MRSKQSGRFAKISAFTLWNIFGYFVVGIVFGSVIVSSWFVYQHLFSTLDEANSIVVLKSTPDIDVIDTSLYTRAKELVSFKSSTSTLPLSPRNIFLFTSTSTLKTP